jgi:hypothetical protein
MATGMMEEMLALEARPVPEAERIEIVLPSKN